MIVAERPVKSEHPFAQRRRGVRGVVTIGQTWRRRARRRADRIEGEIRQVHHGDRTVELVVDGEVRVVPFADLGRQWALVRLDGTGA